MKEEKKKHKRERNRQMALAGRICAQSHNPKIKIKVKKENSTKELKGKEKRIFMN